MEKMTEISKVCVVLTCYNRKEKTINCIQSLAASNDSILFTFVVADDGSNDGTSAALNELGNTLDIHVLTGTGEWYYSRGMHAAMNYVINTMENTFDYVLMVNDDVTFFANSIQKIIAQSRAQNGTVVVGAMQDGQGNSSYGAVKYTKGYHYRMMTISEYENEADTFMANCVLVPYPYFLDVGPIDAHYVHSLGDFDYGLMLKQRKYSIRSSMEYVGVCERNKSTNTWVDKSLPFITRIKLKESPKGAPSRQWFYFLKKNFGFFHALKGVITPFIRILIGQ